MPRDLRSRHQPNWLRMSRQATAPSRADWLRRLAWLPIPLLLFMMVVLSVADLRTAYESPRLLMAVDFLSRTLASLFIVYLAGRSFLVRGESGLLLLGCGVAIWGASGFVATSSLTSNDANFGVTVSNLGVWLAALCHRPAQAFRSGRIARSAWRAHGSAPATRWP